MKAVEYQSMKMIAHTHTKKSMDEFHLCKILSKILASKVQQCYEKVHCEQGGFIPRV